MKTIEIALWFKCNCRCRFCFVPPQVRETAFTTRDIKRELDWGRSQGATFLYLGGGEPTLRRDIVAVIRYAKEIGYEEIDLKTNGILLCYPEFTNRCVEAGATIFTVPIWGANPQEHDFMARAPGSFERTEVGIKNALDSGSKVQIDILVTTLTMERLSDIVRYFSSIGVREYSLWILSLFGMEESEEEDFSSYLPRFTDVVEHARKAFVAADEAGAAIYTSHIPPCVMPDDMMKYYRTIRELDLMIVAPGNKFRGEDSPFEGGPKLPSCDGCRLSWNCLGIREDYARVHGTDEFKPVK
ncbi:MAG: radical SAM protein [bacterium]